jgi:hypothetical protein
MSNNIDSKAVTISVRIYERLLAAYPAQFRREYGPAMAQLFRDQCRDARSSGRGWGLAVLWLRVLPDWAKTSLMEHLASLHRRESMCRKILRAVHNLRPDPRLRTAFIKAFAVVLASAFVWSVFMAYLSPRVYFSTAQIKVQKDDPDVPVVDKIIASYRILTNVIVNLRLDEKLAQQNGSAGWSIVDTFDYLRHTLSVEQTRMTSLLEISVRNQDADLAAKIANQVAASYKEFRLDQWKDTKLRGIKAWKEQLPKIFADLPRLETNLDSYLTTKSDFVDKLRQYHKMETYLDREIEEVGQPNEGVVIVCNPARPSLNSVVPTKLKIFWTWAFGGALVALLAGTGSALLARQKSAR